MATSQKIEFKNFHWLNLIKPDKKEIERLGQAYGFHPLDLADSLSMSQRSKIDLYPNYTFLVLLFPFYNRQTKEILTEELDIFISAKYLVTIHNGNLPVFNDFFQLFQVTSSRREKYPDKSPEKLLYEILSKLFLYVFPMIEHLGYDCDKIEKEIFGARRKEMISEILLIRRNITDFRKIMQVHKNVLKKAVVNFKQSSLYAMKTTDAYFESLVDYTKEIWDVLENLKERIEAIQQTNESQISFRMSDIMRTLTIISVLTFPVTLLATIFGMNTIHSMPFVNNIFGFWYVVGIMLTMIGTMIIIFRKKDWL